MWNDKVILMFLLLCAVILWMMREIWNAEEAYRKFGEYQDKDIELDEHEKRIS